ncbi:BatA domain-containing protein [Microbulbifer hydrolyticus]|uniref:Aerotolerance regulator N-terminal domain-containing protein n=1 Tax=Microbulbifer hydrolyticus TaxID=48074 RepID=A0A6P1TI91_9GAMM|nr:BatA domain-containing protein [Microbulbifer hydrolyticus]MBB5211872.1 hypothetical protein [Microbulbifer hydrolyticus]QHQ40542.1 hypothetical protein GTQ55_17200 [Microbulbifer hydrolyticus]
MPGALTWLIESPAWFWLLPILALPVLIHLLRRSDPREITFAAVHWLQHRRQHRWKKLFVRDRLLLALRLLILLLLILLLAQPWLERDVRPSDTILLVDPGVTEEALAQFQAEHPQINQTFWLHHDPQPADTPRPEAGNLWQALSQLASAGEFRRAHILLQQGANPTGHSALQVSPHWQWHVVETESADLSRALPRISTLPRITLVGEGPRWLPPLIQQLAEGPLPGLALQQRSATDLLDPREIDWVIYDTPGALPERLVHFVRDGGLLISDARVTGETALNFNELDKHSGLEVAVIGRGSWLRYRGDWHSPAFFHNPELPQTLWRQWSTQDWRWLHESRSQWSLDRLPDISVSDPAATTRHAHSLRDVLLLALALLILLERSIGLSRPAAATGGANRE